MDKGSEILASIFERLVSLTSEAERSAEEMRRYLKAMATFRQYSWRNTLLIVAQRPNATKVAGFRTWLKLGRHVRKGEKGIIISAPIIVKESRTEDGEIVVRQKLVGFRDEYVFDISQTDGEALPEPPNWWANRLADERVLALKERVIRSMQEDGISVKYLSELGGARGVSLGGTVVLLENDATVGSLSTAVHEWAHELQRERGRPDSRTKREVEAEAVAFVVLAAFGVDVPENGNYIASWAGGKDGDAAKELRRFFESVLEKARYIIGRIEGRPTKLATADIELATESASE